MTVYIYSPTEGPTGGTELIQQFCKEAILQGFDVKLLYDKDPAGSPIMERFGHYQNPYVTDFDDCCGNAVIFPEHYAEKALFVRHAECAIWWMSVDNYWGAKYTPDGYSYKDAYRIGRRVLYRPIHLINKDRFKKCFHFYQSEYARKYISDVFCMSKSMVAPLSDYIDERYKADPHATKRDIVLYNPKKGIKTTRALQSLAPNIEWVPLVGFSLDELVSIMQQAKVYIDFGGHPGKDRLPREAAMCGCVIITGKRGAAANEKDVRIPLKYKFDDRSVSEVVKAIGHSLSEYSLCKSDFDDYRRVISGEKELFKREVCNALNLLEERQAR